MQNYYKNTKIDIGNATIDIRNVTKTCDKLQNVTKNDIFLPSEQKRFQY